MGYKTIVCTDMIATVRKVLMNFYDWMMQYKGRKTPRGALADLISFKESSFPKSGTREEIESFLNPGNTCDITSDIFGTVWESYIADTNKE